MAENENGNEEQMAEAEAEAEAEVEPEYTAEEQEAAAPEVTEAYSNLLELGLEESVAREVDGMFLAGLMRRDELDQRAIDGLKGLAVEHALAVLEELKASNLPAVSNKSAYMCGIMKALRQKQAAGVILDSGAKRPGPDEAKLKEILDRTGYSLEITSGQRKYGGPPPNYEGANPGPGQEVFCGKLPTNVFEEQLIPLFEKCGMIWDLRLMMDPATGLNKTFCFVTFTTKEGAQRAVKQLDGYEIRPGKRIKVNISIAKVRLFVGNIPKQRSREEIMTEFSKISEGLRDVIIYSNPDDSSKKNRGFAFLDYDSHKDASAAKRKMDSGTVTVWGRSFIVNWAEPQEEPDEEVMAKVKVLYVKNLKSTVSEDQLRQVFQPYGAVERVKKTKDYGFVHFENRQDALRAMEELNGTNLGDTALEISLAKPPSKQKKQEFAGGYGGGGSGSWGGPMPRGGGGGGGGGAGGFGGRGRGRGRGAMGGGPPMQAYGGGYGGGAAYDPYGYDASGGYGDDYYGGGGYDDYSGGYDYYGGDVGGGYGGYGMASAQPPPYARGRGGMGMGGAPMRGRGAMGARGSIRGGAMGGRGGFAGGMGGMRARGARGARGAPRGIGLGMKRKADSFMGGEPKKLATGDSWGQDWSAQPIAQQPLGQAGGDSQWYQDSWS
jgi:heterogeneous nuclear ribonucleoprotein R